MIDRSRPAPQSRPALVVVRDLPPAELAALECVAAQLGLSVEELVEHAIRLRANANEGAPS